MEKRPWRTEFFARFVSEIADTSPPVQRLLELGSGPGFLAEQLLGALPDVACVLLDFSPAMHALARARLGAHSARAQFVERNFKEPDWPSGLGCFQAVVTHQAVHELRHKRHAEMLHAQVRALLEPGGCYLVGDHFAGEGGMQDHALYMTVEEQEQALRRAGFRSVRQILRKGSLVLHRAV